MTKNKKLKFIILSAMIAAVYAGLTLALSAISYGPVQLRVSEALTMLAAFTPAAIPGLTVGCLISNLFSPYGIVDILCGTAATLLASALSFRLRNIKLKGVPVLSALPPVIFNAVIVGAELAAVTPGASWYGFFTGACWIALGEATVCFVLGLPLYMMLDRIKAFKKLL